VSPHLFDMLVPTTAKTHFQFCYEIINGIGFVKGWRLCLAPQRSEFYTHTNIYYFFWGGGGGKQKKKNVWGGGLKNEEGK